MANVEKVLSHNNFLASARFLMRILAHNSKFFRSEILVAGPGSRFAVFGSHRSARQKAADMLRTFGIHDPTESRRDSLNSQAR